MYRSSRAYHGCFRTLGSLHLHIDGADHDAVHKIVRRLEAAGRLVKYDSILAGFAGPQRSSIPDTYTSHNPDLGAAGRGTFSTVMLHGREGTVDVVATAFDDVSPIRSNEIRYSPAPTLPFEIHHAFDLMVEPSSEFRPALDPQTLTKTCDELGICVGSWFEFAKDDRLAFRSNAFSDGAFIKPHALQEWNRLNAYLRSLGFPFVAWTIVEQILGIWRAPR